MLEPTDTSLRSALAKRNKSMRIQLLKSGAQGRTDGEVNAYKSLLFWWSPEGSTACPQSFLQHEKV